MSALGQKQTSHLLTAMSALPLKADRRSHVKSRRAQAMATAIPITAILTVASDSERKVGIDA
jgi:hypothetical protein